MVFLFLIYLGRAVCGAQSVGSGDPGNPGKEVSGKSDKKNEALKIRKPRTAEKAMKAEETRKRKEKRNYEKAVKESQKRSIKIQTPEVQARMKQNKRETASKQRTKKRKERGTHHFGKPEAWKKIIK